MSERPKRSLNSKSNPSAKKHKITPPVSWSSTSRSSSRLLKSPFPNMGSYMTEKNKKLHAQFGAAQDSNSDNEIFRGVSLFVDGFTVPSSQELRAYMLKYGGRYENYFSRHCVTHIICTNLPNTKLKNIRSFSGGLPVVKPTWVLDSVSANKLLSWIPYQLDQLTNNQPRLSDFFAPKYLPVAENALFTKCESGYMSIELGQKEEENLSEVDDVMKPRQKNEDSHDISDKEIHPLINEPTVEGENYLDMEVPDTDDSDTEDNSSLKDAAHAIPPPLSVCDTSHCINNQISKELLSSSADGSYGSHSTLTDPNFVENYFKNSRLHFIGNWRNRYRKRFPNLSKGNNCHGASQKATIIHIDMDCFFVSAVTRKHPELKDKPVAVCHSDNPKGTAEISSANYPARNYGIRAGMFVRDAKSVCSHLVIVPYDFEAYEEIADQFYSILHKHSKKVQAVSCDEAFLEATGSEDRDPEILASTIRKEIFESTGCSASAGIAGNMLLSRLATRNAKPDGQCHIPSEKVEEYLDLLPIKTLPGIGHVLGEKLKKQSVNTCGELRSISKESLQKDFGAKTGEMLWSYSRGIDNRPVGMLQESKSIGADVNWGVRFKNPRDSQNFLANLCKEVSFRLQGCGVQGRSFTLKIKKRRKDAEEPTKYMGHGVCENLSHSITVPVATDDVKVIQRIAKQLFGFFNIDVKEIRGVGLQVSKLENVDPFKQGLGQNSLKAWFKSTSGRKEKQFSNAALRKKGNADCKGLSSEEILATNLHDNNLSCGEPNLSSSSAPPPLFDLDFGVIENLPPEIVYELNEIYGGKLIDFIAKSKSTSKGKGKMEEWEDHHLSHLAHQDKLSKEDKGKQQRDIQEMLSLRGHHELDIPKVDIQKTDIMPSSLSQIDSSVLEQLPDELRFDVLQQLPGHRKLEFSFNSSPRPSKHPPESVQFNTENHLESTDSASKYELWVGSPPKWVNEFSESTCVMLNDLAAMYYKLGSSGNLSSILRCTFLEFQHLQDEVDEHSSGSVQKFCEVLKQYIKLKIKFDIEEIYICFRLLQRFRSKSKYLLHVYETVFLYLQTSVNEIYGGNLHFPSR